jgi:hypothetical protein
VSLNTERHLERRYEGGVPVKKSKSVVLLLCDSRPGRAYSALLEGVMENFEATSDCALELRFVALVKPIEEFVVVVPEALEFNTEFRVVRESES